MLFRSARSATIPIFDQLFTRIGASDDILSGQSTFMVEMFEANNALQNATKKSLIIFDEIGRGTSTYDGMSLAKAMIEYIATNIKAKTLFSTHYHELVQLADNFDNIENYHVEVFEKEVAQSDKSEEIKKKMLEGKIATYFKEQTLMDQMFIKDQNISIEKLLSDNGAEFSSFIHVSII